jgi:hypothetical protein
VLVAIAALVILVAIPLTGDREIPGSERYARLESQEAGKLGSEKQNAVEPPSLPASQRPSSAADAIAAALIANPAQPNAWLALGRLYAARRTDPFAYLETWLPRAGRCFAQAVSYAPADPNVLVAAAGHFVEQAALLAETDGGRGEAIARFQDYYRRAMAVNPSLWQRAADRVWAYFPQERIILGIVPEGMDELRDFVLRYIVSKER